MPKCEESVKIIRTSCEGDFYSDWLDSILKFKTFFDILKLSRSYLNDLHRGSVR